MRRIFSSMSKRNKICFSTASQTTKTVLVLGSNGFFGSEIVEYLKTRGYEIIGADITCPSKPNNLDSFIKLRNHFSISELSDELDQGIQKVHGYHASKPISSVICANGGFSVDDVDDNSHVHDLMMGMNYNPTVAAGNICRKYMTTQNGLFVAFGAAAARNNGMSSCGLLAYGASKNAVHFYVQNFGNVTGNILKKDKKMKDTFKLTSHQLHEYLDQLTVLGILPVMLDTESNRQSVSGADSSTWTNVEDIAKQIGCWIETPGLRPTSGSLIKVETKGGQTHFTKYR